MTEAPPRVLWPGPLLRERLAIVVHRLQQRHDELANDPLDAQALHAYRKAARRTWAAVQLTQTYVTPPRYAEALGVAASLAKGLGSLRDHDVLVQRIAELANDHPAARKELDRAIPRLPDKKRRRRVKRALRKSRPRRLRRLEDALADMPGPPLDPLAPMRATLAIRSRGIASDSSVQVLHAFRLELKAHRYALEALQVPARGADGPAVRLAAECHTATDVLGRIVDAHMLAQWGATVPGDAGAVLLAAARHDDARARQQFITEWATGWPLLHRHIRAWIPPTADAKEVIPDVHRTGKRSPSGHVGAGVAQSGSAANAFPEGKRH